MADRITARERLLKAASELFYNEGIVATGIDAITARAGVAKMSLYNNFSSKADLVQAYVESRHKEWQGIYRARLRTAVTPRDRILAVFDSYLDHAAFDYQKGFRGCGLYNAAAELPMGDPGRTAVATQKEEAERFIRDALEELLPRDPTRAAELAEHMSFLL